MQVTITHHANVSFDELADRLARCTPEAFAEFWFAFCEAAKRHDVDLDALGRAMAPRVGAGRQKPLRTIMYAMEAEIYRHEREGDSQ